MLKPRIIPCLLIHNKGLYKTFKFKDHKYIGDPLNAVRIFNEKNVDELILLDLDKSIRKESIDFEMLSKISKECRMPICYGGGVKTLEEFDKIISLGIEKVSLSSAAINDPSLIESCSRRFGSQSVVVTLDIESGGFMNKNFQVKFHNNTKKSKEDLFKLIELFQSRGVGEMVFNFINRDGMKTGYDFKIIDQIFPKVKVPLTVIGGAGSYLDFKKLFSRYGIIGGGGGSVFVFKGKYNAVLIQYPTLDEKLDIINM